MLIVLIAVFNTLSSARLRELAPTAISRQKSRNLAPPAFITDLLVKANATHSLSFLSGAALKTCSSSRSCCTAEMEAMLGAFTTAQFKSTVERNGGAVVDVFRNKGKRIDGKPFM